MQAEDAGLGPVDVALIAFPDGVVDNQIAGAVAEAIASGAARLLDALLIEKDIDGQTVITDVEQHGDSLEVIQIPGQLPGLLSQSDAENAAAELSPGSAALLIAWENVWAIRLRQSVHESGGVVVLHERIGDQELSEAARHLAEFQQSPHQA